MLVRCLYASRPVEPLTDAIIESILRQSRQNNPQSGITGMLCFTHDVFVQVLEGGRDDVCELFNKIVRDDRHSGVRILLFEEILERRFSGWSMGQFDISKANTNMLLKYSEKAELNPFVSSGRSVMSLLNEFIETGCIRSRGP